MLRLVDREVAVRCPHCSAAIGALRGNSHEGNPFGGDGDTIPGVMGRLDEGQREKAQCHSLMVGSCDACGEDFHFVEINLMDAPGTEDWSSYADGVCLRNEPLRDARYYAVEPGPGFAEVGLSDVGSMVSVSLGPFKPEGNVQTEAGVSSCAGDGGDWERAGDMAARAWPDVMRLAREADAGAPWRTVRPPAGESAA